MNKIFGKVSKQLISTYIDSCSNNYAYGCLCSIPYSSVFPSWCLLTSCKMTNDTADAHGKTQGTSVIIG